MFLNCFHLIRALINLSHLLKCSSQLISAVLHARKFLLSERSLLHKTALGGVACHVEEMPFELPAKLVSEDKPYMDPQNGLSYEK